jgi:hypothetical protein
VSKIISLSNSTNANLLAESYQYMKNNGSSEQSLKTYIAFATFIGSDTTFMISREKKRLLIFLDTKLKSTEEDPDRKSITTWKKFHNCFVEWLIGWLSFINSGSVCSTITPSYCLTYLLFFQMNQSITHSIIFLLLANN